VGGGTEDQDRKDGTKGFAGLSSLVSDVDAGHGCTSSRASTTQIAAPSPTTGKAPGADNLSGAGATNWDQCRGQMAARNFSGFWIDMARLAVGQGVIRNFPFIFFGNYQFRSDDQPTSVAAAANEAINQYNDSDVDRFNTLVADYNSRCSNFRYREGALEIARSEVERFRSDYVAQGRQRFATSNDLPSVSPEVRSVPPPTLPRPEARVPTHDTAALQVSGPEEESVEAACSSDKYLNGPAAYSSCRERQIAQLRNGPRRPDLSGLASAERESIEVACSSDKYLNGPAAYNRCLTTQLRALGSNNRRPSLDSLSSSERESIEAACSSDKYLNGPAAYNQCLSSQLATLGRQARRPNLSNLSDSQRQSIEAACSSDKYLNGPAAYNDCLTRQLQQLR
jgi:hypothetical protein